MDSNNRFSLSLFKKNKLSLSLALMLGSFSGMAIADIELDDDTEMAKQRLASNGYYWLLDTQVTGLEVYDKQSLYSASVFRGMDNIIRSVVNGATIHEGGYISVSGGKAYDIEIVGGELDIHVIDMGFSTMVSGSVNGVTAVGTKTSRADIFVDAGGTIENTVLNNNSWMQVNKTFARSQAEGKWLDLSNSSATNTEVNSGAYLSVYDGGIIDTTTVNSGGIVQMFAGANSAGNLDVYGSGTVSMYTDSSYVELGNAPTAATYAESITLHDSNGTLQMITSKDAITREITVDNLKLNGGLVDYLGVSGASGFVTTNVKNLSGNGVFGMRVAGMDGDFLNVTESMTGNYVIDIFDSGKDLSASGPASEGHHIIHAASSRSDSFSLTDGTVDLGVYQYFLVQDLANTNDWYLSQSPTDSLLDLGRPAPLLSGSAKASLSLANVTPSVWDAELSTLKTRLGELRRDPDQQNGVWSKYITSRYRVANGDVAYDQDMNGFVVGGDRAIAQQNGQLLFGAMASYSRSDIDYAQGGDGKVNSYSAGLYSTYLADSGIYVDGVIKLNHFKADNNVRSTTGKSSASGKMNNTGVGISVETGKQINVNKMLFVEPYALVSGFYADSASYRLSNDMQIDAGATKSVKAEVGTTFGTSIKLANGTNIKPYARIAVAHELNDRNEVILNKTERFNNDMSGTVGKYGVGVTAALNSKWSTYAEVNYAKGSKVEMPYSGNLGVRYSF